MKEADTQTETERRDTETDRRDRKERHRDRDRQRPREGDRVKRGPTAVVGTHPGQGSTRQATERQKRRPRGGSPHLRTLSEPQGPQETG